MRRTLPLVVCLALALLSFVPLSAPVAAQQELPAAFMGRWEGPLVQTNPRNEYPVTIELTGGSVGSVVGTIDYPAGPTRTYPCGGTLALQSVTGDGSRVALVETYAYGQAYCTLYEATVTLAPQTDGSLAYAWSHPNFAGSLTGTLIRTSAPPAVVIPATIPPVLPTPIPTLPPPAAQTVPPATALSGGSIVLADDFSNPARSVFPAASPDASQARYAFESGEFVVEQVPGARKEITALEIPGRSADVTLAVDVRVPSASARLGVGLACRDRYVLLVEPRQGFVTIGDFDQDSAPDWFAVSPAIDTAAAATNRIELRCRGAIITARINGAEVAFIRDAVVQEGVRGLVITGGSAQTAESKVARFDNLEVTEYVAAGAAAPTASLTALAELPADFVGRWEGTVAWDTMTMPVTLDLTGGGIGDVVGTVEYALYGSAGPKCGGDVSLVNLAPDGGEIVLEGTITSDATVCLVDATIQISFQDTGAVGYLWNHPMFTVSGTGTLTHTVPTN